uniref:Uncharacterized protein n=1 Tax=Paramoeba aestuarina TaxID=180227 RepID=A0A7S4P245_9EUKA|mmetsp:Transcript_35034/g.54621  ORF Transcript_35034/g.54621 Transcript_35034/m.54621 type:complete len:218 (+) Transcript_35034:103-756(+)|eukprot:CAMPEP_0201523634 /NCGR_PEP_ID=MMETSP0161_2-20130828/20621_1 /ASSEMBLY_ACC=CAM_ASM_000251 /TAXON_ID=180227 /ORGANISM="Neoparamoeba aestuarina, Strain SoJaBio B1-5/56/2" /LENGTH=217 /DNA_ID=CAMNT_0047922815 /DNA_START=220 /DNA_END=873 /DNA_ORIENTATION=+
MAHFLYGRVCLVTSASSQVGRIVATTLQELGASVLCHNDTSLPTSDNEEKENQFFVDLGTREGVTELVAQIEKRTDRLDLVAHCSGHESTSKTSTPLTTCPIKSLEDIMRVKFRATLQLYQGLHPLLLRSPSPLFLFPLSPQTQHLLGEEREKGELSEPVLAVSGFAMEGLRRALEVSYGGEGGISFASFEADSSANTEQITSSLHEVLKVPLPNIE